MYSKKFDLKTRHCKWVGLSDNIMGALVYHMPSKKVHVAGMLRVYENVDYTQKLLKLPKLTDDDLMDDPEYRKYIIDHAVDSPTIDIKHFTTALGHTILIDEESRKYRLNHFGVTY